MDFTVMKTQGQSSMPVYTAFSPLYARRALACACLLYMQQQGIGTEIPFHQFVHLSYHDMIDLMHRHQVPFRLHEASDEAVMDGRDFPCIETPGMTFGIRSRDENKTGGLFFSLCLFGEERDELAAELAA